MSAVTWNIVLALIWVGVTTNFSAANLLVGFLLGYVIISLTLRNVEGFSGYALKVIRVIRFIGFFVRELFMSNLRVAYDVITPTDYMRPAVIAMPLDARTAAEITIVANLISLTPGTLSLDVSADRRVLYIHVMYLDDREEVLKRIKYFEARVLELLR